MNMKLSHINSLYSNQRRKTNRIFNNSLSVNNIKSIKIKDSNKIKQKNLGFKSERVMNIENVPNKKIRLPKIHLYKKIKNNIKSQLLDIKDGNFFITDQNKIYLNSNKIKISKHKNSSKSRDKENERKSKFNIDSLIAKFDEDYIINSINKKDRQRNKLNKIYGITSDYINHINSAKRKKYLTLKDYQSNIVKAYSFNEKNSDKSINQLIKKLDELREEIESVVPFPKINIKTIFNHIKNKPKEDKILTVKSYINKVYEPRDDYEKEEQLINSLRLKRYKFAKLKYKSMSYF